MKFRTLFATALLLVALPAMAAAQGPGAGGPGAGGRGGPGGPGGFGGGGRMGGAPSAPQLITFEMAKQIVDAAEAEARANNWNMTIVVVDQNNVPIYLRRLPNASAGSYNLATGKARTVVASKLSTADYRTGVQAGTVTAVEDAVTFSGGIPVIINGEFAGAIGVSGASQDQDVQVAEAGLAAITR